MHDNDLHDQLHRLFDDADFRILRAPFDSFDPFKVLKVERYELRHTTTLAWLLDPRQSHGLGDSFLRSFLERTCGDGTDSHPLLAPGEVLSGRVAVQPELRLSGGKLHSPVTAQDEDAAGTAARKTGELDVLIESETWAVAIEAKIDSKEGQGQLHDYSNYLAGRFGGKKRLFLLYLTVEPEADVIEENPEWTGIQWGLHAAEALDAALRGKYGPDRDQALARCPGDERARCEFLHRYLHLLERLGNALHGVEGTARSLADRHYGTLAALKDALREREDRDAPILPWSASPSWAQAYWEHRNVLDVLIGQMRSPAAGFADGVLQLLVGQSKAPLSKLQPDGGNRATMRFVPAEWKQWEVARDGRRAPLDTLMFYHLAFRSAQQDIEIKLLLPKCGEQDLQVHVVEQLLALQKDRGTASVRPDPTYLGRFVARTGYTLKLYSDTLPWTMDDTGPVLKDGADGKMRAFWEAVDEHTALLRTVLSR
jgi:hypothetical protein